MTKRILRGRWPLIASSFLVACITGSHDALTKVSQAAEGRIVEDIRALEPHRVGIVLGCAPFVAGRPNVYFTQRIEAAAALYRAGKVQKLLVSGDNGRLDYDEPTAMMAALVARGVPQTAIVRDFAGFHTLDTMVRAKKVFGVDSAIVITDDFHLPRSLYLASSAQIEAVGYPSHAGVTSVSQRQSLREAVAKVGAVLDIAVLHSQPKFLGKREAI